MTFEKLYTAVNKLDHSSELFRCLDNMMDQARINADDTIYVEKTENPKMWNKVALASLESILSYSTDTVAQAWFNKHGIRF